MTTRQCVAVWIITGGMVLACLVMDVPVLAEQVQIATQLFQVTVAKTPQAYETGLSNRRALAPDEGMWFPFIPAQVVGFWMKACHIPLDFIYVRDGKIVEIFPNRQPCPPMMADQKSGCTVYTSAHPIDGVLEVPGGTADQYHWQLGLPVNVLP